MLYLVSNCGQRRCLRTESVTKNHKLKFQKYTQIKRNFYTHLYKHCLQKQPRKETTQSAKLSSSSVGTYIEEIMIPCL